MNRRRDARPHQPEHEFDDYAEPGIPLSHIIRTLWRYRYPIVLTVVLAGLLYAVVAGTIFLRQDAQRIASLPFHLEFSGAADGMYPNGTRFAASDVVAMPILRQVYERNGLSEFASFKDFSDSIFIIEANEELQSLAREYQSRLSDTRMSAIDRQRIEEEYRLRRQSLSRSDYSINLLVRESTRKIPRSVIAKTLQDTLAVWAEHAALEKGALRYQTPVLSENILSRHLAEEDPVIALDTLRAKINEINRNIDLIRQIPGTDVLRTAEGGASLVELKLQLEDVVRLRLRPLMNDARVGALTRNPAETLRFLQAQLEHNQYRYEEGQARVDRIQDALERYQSSGRSLDVVRGSTPLPTQSAETLTPQIDDSFLNRIMQMAGAAADREYRQELVDDIKTASLATIPHEREISYYQGLIDTMQAGTAGGAVSQGDQARLREELQSVRAEVIGAVRQLNEIYAIISSNLNTSGALYAVTAPMTLRVDRTLSPVRLALIGLLLMMVVIPVAGIGALLHNRMQEEEELEEELLPTEATPPAKDPVIPAEEAG
jgi:hypothetical protein